MDYFILFLRVWCALAASRDGKVELKRKGESSRHIDHSRSPEALFRCIVGIKLYVTTLKIEWYVGKALEVSCVARRRSAIRMW